MSGPPRRRPVPAITPPVFEDERPSARDVDEDEDRDGDGLAPEPPTVPAISITAPTFDTAAKVPGRQTPTFAAAAATGPFAKTHVREGEGRTIFDLPKQTPSGRITAPSFDEAARSGPFAKNKTREGEVQTVSERVQVPPDDIPVPLPPPPRAPPVTTRPPQPRPPPEAKPTEVTDPWEYHGEAQEQAAALSSDYEGGGVELDTAGRLVTPELKGRGRGRGRRGREDSEVSSPADLLSVALDVWPDAPPTNPPSMPPVPRVEPRVDPSPTPVSTPVATPPYTPPEPETVLRPPRPPPEPDTAPRAPPAPRRSAQRGSPPKRSVAAQETVMRAPRGPVTEPEEQFFQEEEQAASEEDLREDYTDDGVPMEEDPAEGSPEEYPPEEFEPADDGGVSPDGETNLRDAMEDDWTGVRGAPRSRGSRWPGRLFKLALLGAAAGAVWLWYTGQWVSVLDDLRSFVRSL